MSGLPRLLFVSHNMAPRQPFGGVEVYQQIVSRELKDRYEILTVIPAADAAAYELYDADGRRLDRFHVSRLPVKEMLRSNDAETIFSKIVRDYDIALVHFQNFINWVPSLPILARALGVRTVWTAHDYYTVCPLFNLIDGQGRSCRGHLDDVKACDACLGGAMGAPVGAQKIRRNGFAEALRHMDVMLFPSQAAKDICAQVYPWEVGRARTEILGQPVDHKPSAPFELKEGASLPIAVYGNFSFNKGADIFMKLFEHFRNKPVVFHLMGRVDAPYGEILDTSAIPNVIQHGGFAPGKTPPELSQCILSMHLSNWPETYCMTLSEAWLAGLVPIVSDIGALGERVTDGENGFKISPGDVSLAIQSLEDLLRHPEKIEKARRGIKSGLAVTPEQHCRRLAEIYQSLLPQFSKPPLARETRQSSPSKVNTLKDIGLGFMPFYWWAPTGMLLNPGAVTLKAIVISIIVRYHYLHTAVQTISAVRRAIVAHRLMSRSVAKISAQNRQLGPWKLAGGSIIFVFGFTYDCICLTGWIAWRVARRASRFALRKLAPPPY